MIPQPIFSSGLIQTSKVKSFTGRIYDTSMTTDQFFSELKYPIYWKRVGWSHTHGENDEVTAFGYVFDNHTDKIIRICILVDSERWLIVERTRENGKQKYKTVCNARTVEELNEFITTRY